MVLTKNDFSQSLSTMFDKQLKTILNENEIAELEKIQNLKKEYRRLTGIEVRTILKEYFDINDTTQLNEFKVNSMRPLKKALEKSGKTLVFIYKKSRIVHISGDWDNAEEIPFLCNENNHIKVSKDDLWGTIDDRGVIQIKPIYFKIDSPVNENLIWVQTNPSEYSYGFINERGEPQTPFNFFMCGKSIIKIFDKQYMIGKNNQGECLYNISESKVLLQGSKYKKIIFNETTKNFVIKNKTNQMVLYIPEHNVISETYDQLNPISLGFQVTKNKKIGVINTKGEIVVPIIYESVVYCDDKKIILKKDNIKHIFKKDEV